MFFVTRFIHWVTVEVHIKDVLDAHRDITVLSHR
jgi:hypothetical protein